MRCAKCRRRPAHRSDAMFGLPLETTLIVIGFPVFWIVYTIVFLIRSRDWERDDDDGGAA